MPEPTFNFDAEPVDVRQVGPTGERLAPFRGRSVMSRHTSYTGALHATEARSANILTLRQLWTVPRTMNEIAAISGLPLSSVCSLKSAIEDDLEEIDMEVIEWGDGRRPTKRTRWRIKR